MKKALLKYLLYTFTILIFFISCNEKSNTKIQEKSNLSLNLDLDLNAQIANYVVEVFEDSKGNLWFGTMSKGLACYNGKELNYFTSEDGLSGNTPVNIAEDKAGDLWIATHTGLSKYDGKTFIDYNIKGNPLSNRISNVLIDSKGTIWVGTWAGVYQFNGTSFSAFPLPLPEIETQINRDTQTWITEVMEDTKGNIWFGRDGYGACKYDGKFFTHFTKKDGLPSNNVQAIEEDKKGNIWFGTRVAEKDNLDPFNRNGAGGLCKFDGKKTTQFSNIEGLSQNDIYTIYIDDIGDVWIGANGLGVYQYDGQSFQIFKGTDRMDLTWHMGIQGILKDKNGNMWFGFSGGLFRLKGGAIINVTENGPWEAF